MVTLQKVFELQILNKMCSKFGPQTLHTNPNFGAQIPFKYYFISLSVCHSANFSVFRIDVHSHKEEYYQFLFQLFFQQHLLFVM